MNEQLLKGKQVLIVDDNHINQMVVKHAILKLGAATIIAGDGREAIDIFLQQPVDLVLMDIQMPGMDGYETTTHLRQQLKSDVPIIAMTAHVLQGENEKCLECGMNGYVAKPFTLESLFNAIHKVLDATFEAPANPNVLTDGGTVIDLSMLYEIAGNDEAYINTMVSTFTANLPVVFSQIEHAMQQKDWDTVFKSAHYAKSSLSVIKVPDIFDWVKQIAENARYKKNLDTIPGLLQKTRQKYAVVEGILAEKFSFKFKSPVVG